jgi:hypothetical protein
MNADDEAARKARADRLRTQIERLTADRPIEQEPDRPPEPESPREFIERRMRETEPGDTGPAQRQSADESPDGGA